MSEALVIGLDTDSSGFHWCSNSPMPDGSVGSLVARGKDAEDRRPTVLRGALWFFERLPEGDVHIFCEEPLALKNGKTTRVLGLAAGAIWSGFVLAEHPSAWWAWTDVSTWKKAVVGKGNASKEEVAENAQADPGWIELSQGDYGREQTYADVFDTNRNLYDAWSLMRYGCLTIAGGSVIGC